MQDYHTAAWRVASCPSPMSPPNYAMFGTGKIRLGICCMAKKQSSKPMLEFLSRIKASGHFEIVLFSEPMILNDPPESWPRVDCCIPFFSFGFPLDKAVRYAEMHHETFFLTEPREQAVLLDRRSVYHALVRNNIPVVYHVICDRDDGKTPTIEEFENHIVINGKRVDKPFVEKPVDSEDHNIRIYYRDGKGSRHLFRKVGNKSSEFYPGVNNIRTEGSFIYETFVETSDAQDVKVYTVGIDYAHAESRKSPVVDGEVQRDKNGKEIRYKMPLNEDERQVARKIVKVFRQRVCGFDLLRTEGQSFVCDVNGWSFVKGNTEYYNTASSIIVEIFLEEMQKRGLSRMIHDRPGKRELKGVLALFRHGDRTPKQKIKLKTKNAKIIEKAFGSEPGERNELVMKGTDSPTQPLTSWMELFAELEKTESNPADREKYAAICCVMGREAEGLKLQLKPQSYTGELVVNQAQVILKWGGWLTDAGRMQARNLGNAFNKRVLRKTDGEVPCKIEVFSNNERRVRNTAIEFAVACEEDWQVSSLNGGSRGGDICSSLDDTEKAKKSIEASKSLIDRVMNIGDPNEVQQWGHLPGLEAVCQLKETPKRAMQHCHRLMNELIGHIPEDKNLHREESSALVRQRWTKLAEGFYCKKTEVYDTTKISDIFDYISYDVSYNQEALFPLDLYPLFELAQVLNNFVGIGEYGLTPESRHLIGAQIIIPLLSQWEIDLQELATLEEPRTRLYFSSESHISALYNVLYNTPGLKSPFHVVADPIHLHYLSHIVMKVYEYSDEPLTSPERLQMEVLFSNGIDTNAFGIVQDHHVSSLTPMIRIHNNLAASDFEKIVSEAHAIVEETSLANSPSRDELFLKMQEEKITMLQLEERMLAAQKLDKKRKAKEADAEALKANAAQQQQ
ncbi:Inositol hexakisphosphate and diphosphoinositol-pentakisphosphate kinase [Diplonema papillatum]|nr:Inositol hexakisphosphate and diphosphoinositol-pentakisphosphate kinase [Diplonema papillatum]